MIRVAFKIVVFLFVTSMLFFPSACKNPEREVKACEASVIAFRIKVANENFEAIFRDASSAFRQAIDRNEFAHDLSRYKNEIGNPDNYELVSWKYSQLINGERLMTLRYITKHESNKIRSEEYVLSLSGDTPQLYNYSFELRSLGSQ